MVLLHQVKNKDIEIVKIDFETLRSLSGWDKTKYNASKQEFVTYLIGLSKKIGQLQGVLRSENGLRSTVFNLFPTFIIDGEDANTLTVRINSEFKYLTNLFDMFTTKTITK